jgi:hypothetical protein
MKIEIWPDDTSMPEMTDWLAELRDDGRAEPADDSPAEPADDGRPESADDSYAPRSLASHPYPDLPAPAQAERPAPSDETGGPAKSTSPDWTQVLARPSTPSKTSPPGWAWTRAVASSPADTGPMAEAGPPAETGPLAEADLPAEAELAAAADPAAEITTRAVIGDQLRMPIMWCEMDSCISRHADPTALGEADARARAIDAGWRVDALGRLVCPQCQQTAPSFRVSRPVVPWDRRTAITRIARMAEARSNGAPWGHGREPRRPGRHRGRPAAETMPADQRAR